VDVQKVIDAMVAEATAQIDDEVAAKDLSAEEAARLKENLSERVGEFVRAEGGVGRPFGPGGFGPGGFGPGGHDGPGPHAPGLHGVGFLALDAAAEALGVSEQELRDALADGRSIADVAKDKGVDVAKVIDAMVAEATARIDEQAARLKADLPERISELVRTEGLPGRGGR
jgi:ribosomal protein S20